MVYLQQMNILFSGPSSRNNMHIPVSVEHHFGNSWL